MLVRYAAIGFRDDLLDSLERAIGDAGVCVLKHRAATAEIGELRSKSVGLVFMGDGNDVEAAMFSARRLAVDVTVVLVVEDPTVDQLRGAMRVGIKEVVDPRTELRRVRELVREAAEHMAETVEFGQVIAVHGVSGGVGTTFVATSLARLMAGDRDRTVVVVDLDQAGGDLLDTLDMPREVTTHDVVKNLVEFDKSKLHGSLVQAGSGFWVLPKPSEEQTLDTLTGEQAIQLLGVLARSFTDVVIDQGAGIDDADRETLNVADHVLLVTTQRMGSVRSLVRRRKTMGRLDVDPGRIKAVVNMYDGKVEPSEQDIAELVGVNVAATVSEDRQTLESAGIEGASVMTIAPRSRVAREMAVLKARLFGEPEPEEERASRWLKLPWGR